MLRPKQHPDNVKRVFAHAGVLRAVGQVLNNAADAAISGGPDFYRMVADGTVLSYNTSCEGMQTYLDDFAAEHFDEEDLSFVSIVLGEPERFERGFLDYTKHSHSKWRGGMDDFKMAGSATALRGTGIAAAILSKGIGSLKPADFDSTETVRRAVFALAGDASVRMHSECLVVLSDTEPVRKALGDNLAPRNRPLGSNAGAILDAAAAYANEHDDLALFVPAIETRVESVGAMLSRALPNRLGAEQALL